MSKPGTAHSEGAEPAIRSAPADGWLQKLSSREIAWLMVRLREFAEAHTWVSVEVADARIGILRQELHARRR